MSAAKLQTCARNPSFLVDRNQRVWNYLSNHLRASAETSESSMRAATKVSEYTAIFHFFWSSALILTGLIITTNTLNALNEPSAPFSLPRDRVNCCATLGWSVEHAYILNNKHLIIQPFRIFINTNTCHSEFVSFI